MAFQRPDSDPVLFAGMVSQDPVANHQGFHRNLIETAVLARVISPLYNAEVSYHGKQS